MGSYFRNEVNDIKVKFVYCARSCDSLEKLFDKFKKFRPTVIQIIVFSHINSIGNHFFLNIPKVNYAIHGEIEL